jgi:hypothetical protein
MSINELHDEAMKIAQHALLAQMKGQLSEFVNLSKDAFFLERMAAQRIPPSHPEAEPSRTILFKSAAFLAYDAALYWDCNEMITKTLAGRPDAIIKTEMNDLLVLLEQKMPPQAAKPKPETKFAELYKSYPKTRLDAYMYQMQGQRRLLHM